MSFLPNLSTMNHSYSHLLSNYLNFFHLPDKPLPGWFHLSPLSVHVPSNWGENTKPAKWFHFHGLQILCTFFSSYFIWTLHYLMLLTFSLVLYSFCFWKDISLSFLWPSWFSISSSCFLLLFQLPLPQSSTFLIQCMILGNLILLPFPASIMTPWFSCISELSDNS